VNEEQQVERRLLVQFQAELGQLRGSDGLLDHRPGAACFEVLGQRHLVEGGVSVGVHVGGRL
jgi:hypothetical protein